MRHPKLEWAIHYLATRRRAAVLPILVSISLLLLPFVWLGGDASLGGDDTRLYFVYPWHWLREFALPAYGELAGFGTYSPQQHFIPFTAVLVAIHFALPFLNLEAFAFGVALVSGFVGVYCTALLLMPYVASGRQALAMLAGIMYVSAPLVATMFWSNPLAWVIGIGGIPTLAALATAYARNGHVRWLTLYAIMSPVYAVGLAALPVSLPFLLGFCVVGGAVLLITQNPWALCRRALGLVAVTLGANAFWGLPLAKSLVTPGSFGSLSLATSGDAATVIRAVAHGQSILDTLSLLPSGAFEKAFSWQTYQLWTWASAFIIPSLALPAVLGAGMLHVPRCRRRLGVLLVALMVATLMLAYFQTVNLSHVGVEAFALLATRVPGFSMFRNFYNKFTAAYVLFFAATFAVSGAIVLTRLQARWRWLLIAVLATVIVLQGGPLLLGMPLFLPLGTSSADTLTYTQVGKLPESYLQAMTALSATGDTGRVLELPLSANYWSEVPLSGTSSVYVGSSPVHVLSGVNTFNSFETFQVNGLPELEAALKRAVDDRDYAAIGRAIRLAGIRYILYANGMPNGIRKRWLQQPAFPTNAAEMEALAQGLGVRLTARFAGESGLAWELYTLPADQTLPPVFVTSHIAANLSPQALFDPAPPFDDSKEPGGVTAVAAMPWLTTSRATDPGQTVLVADIPDNSAVQALRHSMAWQYDLTVNITRPSLVVLLEPYDSAWQAQIETTANSKPLVPIKIRVNGYATAWLLQAPGHYAITLIYTPQRLTWIAGAISMLTVVTLMVLSILGLLRGRTPSGTDTGAGAAQNTRRDRPVVAEDSLQAPISVGPRLENDIL